MQRRSFSFAAIAVLPLFLLMDTWREAGAQAGGTLTIEEHAIGVDRHRGFLHLDVDCDAVFPVPGHWAITPGIGARASFYLPGTAFADSIIGIPPTRVVWD